MRAYQIKITLEGMSPPVWRRLMIPGCLSFSQLAVILHGVMNWEEMGEFQFILGRNRLFIGETGENHFQGENTCIQEFFDKEKKIRYHVLREDRQLQIQVEEILEVTEAKLSLQKFKGLEGNKEEERLKKVLASYQLGNRLHKPMKAKEILEKCLAGKGMNTIRFLPKQAPMDSKQETEDFQLHTKEEVDRALNILEKTPMEAKDKRELTKIIRMLGFNNRLLDQTLFEMQNEVGKKLKDPDKIRNMTDRVMAQTFFYLLNMEE